MEDTHDLGSCFWKLVIIKIFLASCRLKRPLKLLGSCKDEEMREHDEEDEDEEKRTKKKVEIEHKPNTKKRWEEKTEKTEEQEKGHEEGEDGDGAEDKKVNYSKKKKTEENVPGGAIVEAALISHWPPSFSQQIAQDPSMESAPA